MGLLTGGVSISRGWGNVRKILNGGWDVWNSMYGRGEAVKLDLGGSGSGGVTDSEITVYGFWVKSWCNLISSTQAKRKRSEQTGKAYGQCKGERKPTATSNLLGYFSGLAKVANLPSKSDP